MFQTFSKTTKTLGFFIGVIAISLSLSYLVLAWTEPPANPPNSNVSTPLNIGPTGQSKSGGLILNTGGAPNGLIVQNGNVGIGTASPGAKLEVNGSIKITSGSGGAITFSDGTTQTTAAAEPYLKNYAKTAVITQSGWNVAAPSPLSELVDADTDVFTTDGSIFSRSNQAGYTGPKTGYVIFDLGGSRSIQKISVQFKASIYTSASAACSQSGAYAAAIIEISSDGGNSYSTIWQWQVSQCASQNIDQLLVDENFRTITHLRFRFYADHDGGNSDWTLAGASFSGKKVVIVGE